MHIENLVVGPRASGKRDISLESEKVRGCFILKMTSQGCGYSTIPNLSRSAGDSFIFGIICKIQNSRLFHLSEDHRCWVNLWNHGM